MAVGVSDVAALSSLWQTTVYEDALAVVRDQNVLAPLVTTFTDRVDTADRVNLEWNASTVQTVAETDDYQAPEKLTKTSLATLTPSEAIGQVSITDRRARTDPDGIRNFAAADLGAAFAAKVDTDVASNFSSLTAGTIGASGTVITWGHVAAAKAVLAGSAVPGPYRLVIHDYQWFKLFKEVSIAGNEARQNTADSTLEVAERNYYVGNFFGIDIFISNNVPTTGTDARGALFNASALALDWRQAPRLEPERDASARETELNLVGDYAHGVWRPKFGVQLLFDNATPTS